MHIYVKKEPPGRLICSGALGSLALLYIWNGKYSIRKVTAATVPYLFIDYKIIVISETPEEGIAPANYTLTTLFCNKKAEYNTDSAFTTQTTI